MILDKDGEDKLGRSCWKIVLKRVQAESNILHTTERTKTKWIGHILRRNCLIQHVIFRKIGKGIEVTGRRERRRKQILDDLKGTKGNLKLKEETLDRTLWGNVFGRRNGAVV